MPNFFLKHKKFILSLALIFLVSSLGILIFGAGEARATWYDINIGNIGYTVLAWIIAKIGSLIKSLVSIFFWLSSMMLEMAFGLEKFTDAEVVKTGWGITRDVANMLFVVGLLIIAGATALNLETYGAKKLLPKLIIAALLINFSLVIAGVVIDFTQVTTHFFYDEINAGNGITAQISQSLSVSKMPEKNPGADVAEKLAAGIAGVIMLIFSIFLEIVLILAASIAIAIGAFFLIVRMITLWILLILAPLAWLMWILPATGHLWQKWWSEFFKWAFFAPIYAFFIYLAVATSSAGGTLINSKMKDVVSAAGWKERMWSMLIATPDLFMQFLVIVGLLFGGLIVAQEMSLYSAKGAIGIAKGIGGKVSGVTAVQQRWKTRKAVKEDEAKERVKRKMGLRRVGGGIGSVGQIARERRPTVAGRAEARAKKNKVVSEEAQKLGETMNRKDVTKIAGKRMPLTSAGRARKLAAQSLLAHSDSEAYGKMMSKPVKTPRTEFGHRRIRKLANKVDNAVSKKKKEGKFARYPLPKPKRKKEEKPTPKTRPASTEQEKPKIEVVTPVGTGGKFSDEERAKMRREAGIT